MLVVCLEVLFVCLVGDAGGLLWPLDAFGLLFFWLVCRILDLLSEPRAAGYVRSLKPRFVNNQAP